MIDAEFVQAIADLKADGTNLSIVTVPREPKNVYLTHNHKTGEVLYRFAKWPDNRSFTTLDSLVRWGWTKPSPKAWVSINEITVTTDDEHQSRGVYSIGVSPQIQQLYKMEGNPVPYDQRTLVLLLRTTFADCVPEMLVALLRNLKWQNSGEQSAVIGNQSANLGKTMNAQVRGTGDLPEVIDFTVPMVADPFLQVNRERIGAAMDIDFEASKFKLHILPLHLAGAVKSAVEQLRKMTEDTINTVKNLTLTDDEHPAYPVYVGKVQ